MRGTLFSADFVEDINGNLRLLEINTDTTISTNNLTYMDFTEFISLLSDNNITKVTVIYKVNIHQGIVDKLSESLEANAPFITEFNKIPQQANRIYPMVVDDADDLFILRLAYDESAILDSEYAKGILNLLKLFSDYGEQGKVSEFYHSSSLHGEYDTITKDLNQGNIADCLIKGISDIPYSLIDFYKIGSELPEETNQNKWNAFITNKSNYDNLIQKYHVNQNAISNDRVSSIRTFSIVYGSDLSLIHLAQFEENAIFNLPTIPIYNENQYVNRIDNKHYYEFATNFIKSDGSYGILNTHLVVKPDNTEVEIGNVAVGDELKSYWIEGVNVNESDIVQSAMVIEGNSFPSGSTITSSSVIYKNTKPLLNKTISNIVVNNNEDSLFVSPNKAFLVYQNDNNTIVWKYAYKIIAGNDYLIDSDGSTAQVTSNEILIINEDGFSFVEVDVEDVDTYIIAGSTPINAYIVHNPAPPPKL